MKKIILFFATLLTINFFTFTSAFAAVCDQSFNGWLLRYDKTYEFYDVWNNNGTQPDYMNNCWIGYTQGGSWDEWTTANWSYLDKGSDFAWTQTLRNRNFTVAWNSSLEIINSGNTKWRIQKKPSTRTNGTKNSYDFGLRYRISYDNSNNYPNTNDDKIHTECIYYSVTWCGDGVRDAGYEVCDPNDPSKAGWWNGGCNNKCEPITVNPPATCDAITVSPSGGQAPFTTNVACSGTNANSYKIQCGNGQVINARTGVCSYSVGSNYQAQCIVNGNITSNACKKTVKVTNPTPGIRIDKLDANNADLDGVVGNDTQTVIPNNKAVFKIRVTNSGNEALKNLQVTDALASACAWNVTLPNTKPSSWSGFRVAGSGNHSNNVLEPGEYFEYTCEKGNTTAPYDNRANTRGVGVTSGGIVTDTDDTEVLLVSPSVQIVKTDSNPALDLDTVVWNDTQTVNSGTKAVFKIRVTNDGTEPLKNLVVTDAVGPNCAWNVTLPNTKPSSWSGFKVAGSGNHSNNVLEPGEYFEYTCEKGNTTANYTNIANISAQWNTSNITVTDSDPTDVIVKKPVDNTYDLALRKTLSTTTPWPFKNGDTVTFQIRVFNQWDVDSWSIEITDYIPEGLKLDDTQWTESADRVTPGVINRYAKRNIWNTKPWESTVVSITFKIDTNLSTTLYNYAEISKDTWNDCDSIPDAINGNQAGEKDSTGLIDNSIGSKCEPGWDEDDHDVESIDVNKEDVNTDVYLVKSLASDQPISVKLGDTVHYIITVYNSGSVVAENQKVQDQFREASQWALELVPGPNWTENNGIATYKELIDIPAKGSVSLDIYFTIAATDQEYVRNLAIVCDETTQDCTPTEPVCDPETEDCCEDEDEVGDKEGCVIVYTPRVMIDKTDANPGFDQDGNIGWNDSQKVNKWEKAVFKIRVTNNGWEDLDSIVLTDVQAPNCAGTVTLPGTYPSTWSNFTTGWTWDKTDWVLESGEYFEYTCEKTNTQNDYTNTARVDAKWKISKGTVNDSDDSRVDIDTGGGSGSTYRCDDIVKKSGNTVTCVWNSKVKSFKFACGTGDDRTLQYKNAVKNSVTGRMEANFNCGEVEAQCFVENDANQTEEFGPAWRSGNQCVTNLNPFCGDGVVNNGEQCDISAAPYGDWGSCWKPGTARACKLPGGGSNPDPSCEDDNSCVLTWPNDGELIFGPRGFKTLGHNVNPLVVNGEKPYLYNNSDYDFSFDEICVTTNVNGISLSKNPANVVDGMKCLDLTSRNRMIYAYERIELDIPTNFITDKAQIPSWKDFGTENIVTTIKDDGILYDTAYFAGKLEIRVAKPAVSTVGWGTSYVKSTDTWDVKNITDGKDTNFVWVSASDDTKTISSNVEEVNSGNSDVIDSINNEKDKIDNADSVIDTSWVSNATLQNYNGLVNVFIYKGADLKISSIPTDLNTLSAPRTYIVEGANLVVDRDVVSNKNIAFVVRWGNILIEDNVKQMDGTYISIKTTVWGKIIAEPTSKQLVVDGSLYGDIKQLVENRYYISDSWDGLSVGTIVSFGSSLFTKPAPLVSQFVGEYLESVKVAK